MDVDYKLSAKRVELNVLEAERDAEELWKNDEYQRLQREIAELESQLEDDAAIPDSERSEPFVVKADGSGESR